MRDWIEVILRRDGHEDRRVNSHPGVRAIWVPAGRAYDSDIYERSGSDGRVPVYVYTHTVHSE